MELSQCQLQCEFSSYIESNDVLEVSIRSVGLRFRKYKCFIMELLKYFIYAA
jgi:hypothetical protein